MKSRKSLRLVLATAAVTLGVSLVTSGSATAGPSWTDFGSGTGIQSVTYNGTTDSMMNRSASGIVHQWLTPAEVGTHGAYYVFKPLSGGAVTTPFKQSCDSQGLVGTAFPSTWQYLASNYTPAGVLSDYFPYDGLSYWVCEYDLSNWASGDIHYTLGSTMDRHVTFDVQMAAPGFPASGWMTYSDINGSYTVDVTAVYISGHTATFSGYYPSTSTTQWIVLQATNHLGVLSWGGDVVTTDPGATLSTFVPTTIGAGVTGTINVYTR
jgi:hypothetical protein